MMDENEIWERIHRMKKMSAQQEDTLVPVGAESIFKVDEEDAERAVKRLYNSLDALGKRRIEIEVSYNAEKSTIRNRIDSERQMFGERTRVLWQKSRPEFAQIEHFAKELKSASGKGLKSSVEHAFHTIFRNMHAKTVVVCGKEGSNQAITVGKFGFGYRRYQKSQQVKGWYGIEDIAKRYKEVAAGLRAENMDRWARRVELFFGHLPDVKAVEDGVLEFAPLKPLILISASSYSDEPFSITKIGLTADEGLYFIGERQSSKYYLKTVDANNWQSAYMYMQIRDDLPKYIEIIRTSVEIMKRKSTEWDEHLVKNFGREMLMRGV